MANAEWEKLKQALREAPTPEARKEASKAFQKFRAVQLARGKGSKPTIVSLGFDKKYPTAVAIDDIPDELERNPEFFEHMREILEEE